MAFHIYISLLLILLDSVISQGIIFRSIGKCLPLEDCPTLSEVSMSSALTNFQSCGANERDRPKFLCPEEDDSFCDCKSIFECNIFKKLLDEQNFDELRKQRQCGFQGTIPKYCCPVPKMPQTTTIEPVSVSGRIDLNDDENSRFIASSTTSKPFSSCGIATGTHIFGGIISDPHEFPWMAALVYETPEKDSELVLCGGAVISSTMVLTAAHCIDTLRMHSLTKVRLGHANLTSGQTIDVPIKAVHPHENFGEGNFGLFNDIAILQLEQSLKFSAAIRPICLPEEVLEESLLADDESSILMVAGWGANENSTRSNILLHLQVNYLFSSDCEQEFQERSTKFSLRDTQLCAKGSPGADSCRGDSGGPLMRLDLETGLYEILGITSFGTIHCDSSTPAVYTRISEYLPFIMSKLEPE